MSTCILFTENLTEDGCLSIKLSDNNDIVDDLEKRSFTDIQALQTDSKTIIVDSSIHHSVFAVNLPSLSNKKARQAMPYALEERIAQPFSELHFSFDKKLYINNQYIVVVTENERMNFITSIFEDNNISFHALTLDFFAFQKGETGILNEHLIVNSNEFKGALSRKLAEKFLKTIIDSNFYLFDKSKKISSIKKFDEINEPSEQWIAKRIAKTSYINLCQGKYQIKESSKFTLKQGYQLLGGVFILWLVSIIFTDLLQIYELNTRINDVDQKIKVIYKQFFPDAQRVINPKFRVRQMLEKNKGPGSTSLWVLLSKLTQALKDTNSKILKFKFQNEKITMTVASPDFSSLEKLEQQMTNQKLSVKQTQAASKDKQVIATLEIM